MNCSLALRQILFERMFLGEGIVASKIELGEVQGAMSGLSIVITGITVVILAPLTAPITNLFF